MVSGLWFASLMLALASALVCILARQWIQAYFPRSLSGTPRDQADERQSLFDALSTWHVGAIIESTSMVLHLSLNLFFAGLVVFAWSLDTLLGQVMLSFVCAVVCLYISSLGLPLFFPSCPYHTPLLSHFQPALRHAISQITILLVFLKKRIISLSGSSILSDSESEFDTDDWEEAQTKDTTARRHRMLHGLFNSSRNQDVHRAIAYALAGAPPEFVDQLKRKLIDGGSELERAIHERSVQLLNLSLDASSCAKNLDEAELCCRAGIKLSWTNSDDKVSSAGYWFPVEIIGTANSVAPAPAHMCLSALAQRLNDSFHIGELLCQDEESLFVDTLSYWTEESSVVNTNPSLWCLFLECFTRYLSLFPLSLKLGAEDMEPGEEEKETTRVWTTTILQLLCGILRMTRDEFSESELRLPAAHALLVALRNPELQLESIPGNRVAGPIADMHYPRRRRRSFKEARKMTDIVSEAFYYLLDPQLTWVVPWLTTHGFLSMVIDELCDWCQCLRNERHGNAPSPFTATGLASTQFPDSHPHISARAVTQRLVENLANGHLDISTLERSNSTRLWVMQLMLMQVPGTSMEPILLENATLLLSLMERVGLRGWAVASVFMITILRSSRLNFSSVFSPHLSPSSSHSPITDVLASLSHARMFSGTVGILMQHDEKNPSYYIDRKWYLVAVLQAYTSAVRSAQGGLQNAPTEDEGRVRKIFSDCLDDIFQSSPDIFDLFLRSPQLSTAQTSDLQPAGIKIPRRWNTLMEDLYALAPDDARWKVVYAEIASTNPPPSDATTCAEPDLVNALRARFSTSPVLEGNTS